MIGIVDVASYIPEKKIDNFNLAKKFGYEENFIKNKIGVKKTSKKAGNERSSDLGIKAIKLLQSKVNFRYNDIDCLILITQNPDYVLPHTSAIIHGKLPFTENCACFDVSLGCSGFVYGLSIAKSFMESNNFKNGIIVTSDPYSEIVDSDDKNTSLLFGDASAAILLSDEPKFEIENFTFGTSGTYFSSLINNKGVLRMDGREIFNFVARKVPLDVQNLLEKNRISIEDIDLFIFHQGSKFIIDTIIKRLRLPTEKVPFMIQNYGNTVSSSIPIVLESYLDEKQYKTISLSGFGVGLSWSSVIIKRNNK